MRLGRLWRSLGAGGTALVLAATAALGVTPLPALAGGGGVTWSQSQPVLTLQGTAGVDWASNLVVSGSNQYWVYVNPALWLATNAGGTWKSYNLGVSGLKTGGGFAPTETIAVQNGTVYVPYIASDGSLNLDYNPSGNPGGPWVQASIVTPNSSASCGLGTETNDPSAAIAGNTLYVAFQDGSPCTVSGAGSVYLASVSLASLPQAGGTAAWNIQNVAAAAGNAGMPVLASDGQTVSLAWDLNYGTLQFMSDVAAGQAQTVFTPPNDFGSMRQIAVGLVNGTPVHVAAVFSGGTIGTAYVATDAGGSWADTQMGPSPGVVTDNTDSPSAAVSAACGPVVAYNSSPNASGNPSGDTPYVATFAGGKWSPVAVGAPSTSGDPLQFVSVAAAPGGMDVLYVNNDGSSPELYAATATCGTSAGPVVTSVSPTGGPAAGGTQITVNGSGFTGATAVVFAGSTALGNAGSGGAAASFQVVSDTQITATSPPGSGTVDVRVLTPGGESAAVAADQFTYQASGGTGTTGFTDLGGYAWAQNAIDTLAKEGIIHGVGNAQYDPAGNVTRAQFACLMQHAFALPQPASPVAFADVSASGSQAWAYPCVEAAAPYYDYYQLPGGGFAFHPDQGFDRQDVATVIVRILVQSGKLQLASAAQTQAILGKFTDASAIAPALQPYVATAVQAGIMAGFPDGSFQPQTILNRAQVAAVLLKLQNYFVVVGSGGSGTSGGSGSSQGPWVTSIRPDSGSFYGGTVVTIFGSGFAAGDSVTVNYANVSSTIPAANVQVVSATEITATMPATGYAGPVDVQVCAAGTCSERIPNFTYNGTSGGSGTSQGPVVTSISPDSGSYYGGTPVTITGSGFAAGDSVTVTYANLSSPVPATNVQVVSATEITATMPATGYAGSVDVQVCGAGTCSARAPNFTYNP